MRQILQEPNFKKTLVEIAQQNNQSLEEVHLKAAEYLKDLHTIHQPMGNIVSTLGIDYLLRRGYDDHIDVEPLELRTINKLTHQHPTVFVMTHKTHMDMAVLASVLVGYGLSFPYSFGDSNLNIAGLGQLGKQTGIIFAQSSIEDNLIYKATLIHYITHLLNKKSSFMWAIEGTYSPTGKLICPEMGMLKYIMEAEQLTQQKVKYIPVSIDYDLIPDVKTMTQKGKDQKKKSLDLISMVNYLTKMRKDLGRISVRFGTAFDANTSILATYPEQDLCRFAVSPLAIKLVNCIHQIKPITTVSLVCFSLLNQLSLTKSDLKTQVAILMDFIEKQRPQSLLDSKMSIDKSVQTALDLLYKEKIIDQIGDEENGHYAIAQKNYLQGNYYANMSMQYLHGRAFTELSLMHLVHAQQEDQELAFWTKMMSLRDLFKFEFFFSDKPSFSDEIEAQLDCIHTDWNSLFFKKETKLTDILRQQNMLIAPNVLLNYVEAYQVIGEGLLQWNPDADFNEKDFVDFCYVIGEDMKWEGNTSRIQSVSKPFLFNGIRLVKNRDLIPTAEDHKKEAITKYLEEIEVIADYLYKLENINLVQAKLLETELLVEESKAILTESKGLIAEVMASEEGPHIGVFFDLDRTLISTYSATEFFRSRVIGRKMSPLEAFAQIAGVLVYMSGNRNFSGMMATSTTGLKGLFEQTFIEHGEEVYLNKTIHDIYPEARALVAAHLAKGHTVAIVSAATPYQVNPVAKELNMEHIMCTRMEIEEGKFTGRVIRPTCWGEGKAFYARNFANEFQLDLSKSYFYTDSVEDLPLLEIVGHPRPINPDNKLTKLAVQRNWPMTHFSLTEEATLLVE